MKITRITSLANANPLWAGELGLWWACSKAERLAKSACFSWALAFWMWALSQQAASDEQTAKRAEVRLLRAANVMSSWGCPDPLYRLLGQQEGSPLPMMLLKLLHFPALSDAEYKLAFDALDRGTEPDAAIWPRQRRNKRYVALMAAAQTIAQHATRNR